MPSRSPSCLPRLPHYLLLLAAALLTGLAIGRRQATAAPAGPSSPAGAEAVAAESVLDAREAHLPALASRGWGGDVCERRVFAQVLGASGPQDLVMGSIPGPTTRLLLLQWGENAGCPGPAAEPLKLDCSGPLVPGSAWMPPVSALLPEVRSAALFSLHATALPVGSGSGDACAELRAALIGGRAGTYRRFLEAYRGGAAFPGLLPGWRKGGALAVTVQRSCGPAGSDEDARAGADYPGISAAAAALGRRDDGRHQAWLAGLAAGQDDAGRSLTTLSVQNLGLDCATVEVFAYPVGQPPDSEPEAPEGCRPVLRCDDLSVAPGAAVRLPLAACGSLEGTVGIALQSTEPLAVVADSQDGRVMAAVAAEPRARAAWSAVLPGLPAAWRPVVQVLNPNREIQARVRVYLLDRSGDIVTIGSHWICPQASASIPIAAADALGRPWDGRILVESLPAGTGSGAAGAGLPVVASLDLLPPTAADFATPPIAALSLEMEPLAELGGPDVTLLALPRIGRAMKATVASPAESSVMAVANLAARPGFTEFTTYIYDTNGLLDFVCQKLFDGQVEAIDLATWGYVNSGFRGSAVVSASYWEHEARDREGQIRSNQAHLAAWQLQHRPDDAPLRWRGAKAQALAGADAARAAAWLGILPGCPALEPRRTPRPPTATAPSATPATPPPTATTSGTTPEPPSPTATEAPPTEPAVSSPVPSESPSGPNSGRTLWLPWLRSDD